MTVNGPWFVSETRMSAPNRPVSTCAPSARNRAITSSTSGSAISPGAAEFQVGRLALPGVPVESELRNHQKWRIHIGAGLLALQDADRPELAGELRRLFRGVPVGDSHQHTQALADDFADHRGAAALAVGVGHRDARTVHPLYHCTHTDQPILG